MSDEDIQKEFERKLNNFDRQYRDAEQKEYLKYRDAEQKEYLKFRDKTKNDITNLYIAANTLMDRADAHAREGNLMDALILKKEAQLKVDLAHTMESILKDH